MSLWIFHNSAVTVNDDQIAQLSAVESAARNRYHSFFLQRILRFNKCIADYEWCRDFADISGQCLTEVGSSDHASAHAGFGSTEYVGAERGTAVILLLP